MTPDLEPLAPAARDLRQSFDALTAPHREALWRFCRGLTGNPWDAEDLLQDTLLRAFARLSATWQPVEPRAYLFRIASNAWIDAWRRRRPTDELDDADILPDPDGAPDPLAARQALEALVTRLPPRQRVVFLLTESFGFSHAEAAGLLAISEAAVKAARARARAALAAAAGAEPSPRRRLVSRTLLDRYVDAFNRRDVDALVALFAADAENDIVGVAEERGVGVMRQNSLGEWLADPTPTRAEVRAVAGEPVIVVLQSVEEGVEAVAWLLRLEGDAVIRRQRLYCFCPELLHEAGAELRRPVRSRGYTYAAP